MTNPEILKLAKACGFDNFQRRKFDVENDYGTQWECWEDQLLNFARAIRKNGYYEGYEEGYKSGSTGVFGEPLG